MCGYLNESYCYVFKYGSVCCVFLDVEKIKVFFFEFSYLLVRES